jgi:hypothetical protein
MRAAGAARRIVLALGALAAWMVSCRDIPAPEGGVAAVGPLRFPSPGVVAGDTMRDSTGVAAPLTLVAYGTDGEPLTAPPAATFIVIDTTAHMGGSGNLFLVGDHIGTVRVVGEVGALQTRQAQAKVTLRPDTLTASDSLLHHVTYSLSSGDSVVSSPPLKVDVKQVGATSTGVEAVIVRYSIDRAPLGTPPTLLLMNGSVVSERDTTETSGGASRVARLRLKALSTFAADTAFVTATSSYRGRVLGTVTFTIIYTKQ